MNAKLYTLLILLPLLWTLSSTTMASQVPAAETRYLVQISQVLAKDQPLQAWALSGKLLSKPRPSAHAYYYGCSALSLLPTAELTNQPLTPKACWQQGFDTHPTDARLALPLASTLLQEEQASNSLAVLTSTQIAWQTLAPGDLQQRQYMLAYSYYLLKQYQQLLSAVGDVITPSLRPLVIEAHLGLSDWSEADAEIKRWLNAEPADLQAWQYARRLAWAKQDNVAIAAINEILILLNPSDTIQIEQLGLYANMGAANLAAECLNLPLAGSDQLWCLQQGKLAVRYQETLTKAKQWQDELKHLDDYWLLIADLSLQTGDARAARHAWRQVGKSVLSLEGDNQSLAMQRKNRDQKQALATFLIAQSLWREQRFDDAEVYYRKLKRLPGYQTYAEAYLALLSTLQQPV